MLNQYSLLYPHTWHIVAVHILANWCHVHVPNVLHFFTGLIKDTSMIEEENMKESLGIS